MLLRGSKGADAAGRNLEHAAGRLPVPGVREARQRVGNDGREAGEVKESHREDMTLEQAAVTLSQMGVKEGISILTAARELGSVYAGRWRDSTGDSRGSHYSLLVRCSSENLRYEIVVKLHREY